MSQPFCIRCDRYLERETSTPYLTNLISSLKWCACEKSYIRDDPNIDWTNVKVKPGRIVMPETCPDCYASFEVCDCPKVKDSGNRTKSVTGAERDKPGGNGRFDLISPIALRRLALIYEGGAQKYSDRNWELGLPLSSCLDSAMRHINKLADGQEDEDHAAMAAWNMFAFMHIQQRVRDGALPKILDDLPNERNLSS